MAYNVKTIRKVLGSIRQGMTISDASKFYNVDRQTIYNWLSSADQYSNSVRTLYKRYSIEEKVEVIHLAEEGVLSVFEIGESKHISSSTIRAWIRDKNHILALYSSQGHGPKIRGQTDYPGEEAVFVGTANDKDAKQHLRDLKDENEYLKAKVAYLETLMELNGTPASGFKKKRNIRPSIKSSNKVSET